MKKEDAPIVPLENKDCLRRKGDVYLFRSRLFKSFFYTVYIRHYDRPITELYTGIDGDEAIRFFNGQTS